MVSGNIETNLCSPKANALSIPLTNDLTTTEIELSSSMTTILRRDLY